ncbi:MAG: three-Cys-motif partner protein TcmP [Gammaproteobacteria bacterium]
MQKNKMPTAYIGKEQAYVKHTILRTYLQRLFMIVGRGKEPIINYVDCFAGPWQEEDDKLSDTSIGISLEQMALCQQSLEKNFSRKVSFRALYIEKDPGAYNKLHNFLSDTPYPTIETKCLQGDYTELLDEIVDWCGSYFSFFFVDPTGWQNVVGAKTMQPLLRLGKAEFLINLMYDFINRFVGVDKHTGDMVEIFGEAPTFKDETPEERQLVLLSLYRKNLLFYYGGRSAFVPVEKPGKARVHYYLVYLTRHVRGIDVFKTEAEKMEHVQRITQQEFKLRQQINQSATGDLFGDTIEGALKIDNSLNNKLQARQYLLGQLSKEPTLIDCDKWADFLEESDLYPSDLQIAMKELVKEGLVKNINADVSQRRTKIIKPNWPNKSERWVLV